MPTSSSSSSGLLRCRRGVAATEFALLLPLLTLLLVGIYEFGSYFAQANVLEKSLRAGAMFASRSDLPLSSAARTQIENIVKTGDPAGGQAVRLSGWSDGSASFTISTRTYAAGGEDVELIKVEASVPYQPLVPGLLSGLGFSGLRMRAAHEQAHLGG